MGRETMKEGIKRYVHGALDAKDKIAAAMIDAGVDPKEALLASSVVTKQSVDELVEREIGNRSAAQITSSLARGASSQLN